MSRRAACVPSASLHLPPTLLTGPTWGIMSTQKPCIVLNQTNIDTCKSEIKMFQKSYVHPRMIPKPNTILFPEYLLDHASSHAQRNKQKKAPKTKQKNPKLPQNHSNFEQCIYRFSFPIIFFYKCLI